ncbi:MAG: substrate-binding domain-containing protein [Clostridiales bacterium]|nr:substrate-binding domain-containing protein [Clostridiales bacterium]
MKKKLVAIMLVCVMVFSLAACGSSSSTTETTDTETTDDAASAEAEVEETEAEETADASVESPLEGKKVAYIMLMSSATIFQMWSDSFTETAEALGMEADTFFCSDNAETWQDTIAQCAAADYDGLMVSHGGQEYAWAYLSEILEQYPDLKIATFDTPFKDENGDTATIDGVAQFFQQDAGFATMLLDYLMEEVPENAEKIANGEALNILQVQQGAGYNSPFDRRQVGYDEYVDAGYINTVERIAPTDDQNATSSMYDVTVATLAKYSEDDIDGIWVCYDAYAQGVYQALSESGLQIPMVSVDCDNTDIQYMQEEGSMWMACATTNWTLNGEFACRVLALEMADQYEDIEAASCYYDDPGMWMEIPSSIITQEMVTSADGITIENVDTVAADSYSDTSWMPTCDWMVELLGY